MGGFRSILSIFFCLAVLTQPSIAQRFPAKPITMVVPYAPRASCRPRSVMRSDSRL